MSWFGWVTAWLGGPQPVRTFHHLLMYYLLIFLCAHLYMSLREDIMGGGTQVSTMINGIRFFKEPIRQPGNEDIPPSDIPNASSANKA